MKVKVKGLVFVGFAAAILSANAMAENEAQTVTSKAFTEATYQKLSNLATQGDATGNTLSTTSDTTYPSEKKVAAALEAVGGTVGNGTIDIQLNGTSKGTFTVNQAGPTTVNVNGVEVTSNKVDSTTGLSSASTDTQYPSAKAVYDALNGAEHANFQTYSTTANQISNGTGGWKDLDSVIDATTAASGSAPTTGAVKDYVDNNSTTTTVAESQTDGAIAVTTDGVTTQVPVHNAQTTTNLSNDLATDASSTTKYPSVKVVKDALDAKVINDATLTVQLNGTSKGTFTANDADNTTINIDGVEVTSNKTQTVDSNSTSTQYPSAEAVYNAIDNATGGLTIPAQNANVCTAQHPCALVNEAGTLHWYTMAQDGYAGGDLGDAPANP